MGVRRLLSFAASTLVTALLALLFYNFSEAYSGYLRIAGFLVVALATGWGLGACFGAALHRWIGAGAFIGVAILWIPAIVATYSFALLLGTPVLMGYAVCVAAGARQAGKNPPAQ